MADTLTTSIGTMLFVSLSAPTTEDAAGYAALGAAWIEVGEIEDVPEHGAEYAEANFTPLKTGIKAKYHDELDYGSISVPLAISAGDAGQAALKTAIASKARVSFKIEYPKLAATSTAGPIEYTQGKVFGFTKGASKGSVVKGNAKIGFERPMVDVAEATV